MKKPVAPARQLVKATLRDLRAGWKRYLLIGLILAPFIALALIPTPNPGLVFTMFMILGVAMAAAAAAQQETGRVATLGKAYYGGSAFLIATLIIVFYMILMYVPAMLGLWLYQAGSTVAQDNASIWELVLIGLVSLALALPTVALVTRFGLAPLVAVTENLRPFAALGRSSRLIKYRFWRVLARQIILGLLILGILVILFGLMMLLSLANLAGLAAFLYITLSILIVFPLFNVYELHLYQALIAKPEETK